MSESKVDLILHPIRMRIILTISGRQMTAQALAAALPDVAQATLYRHINALAEGGILQVVAENPVRGTVEKVYSMADEMAGNLTPDDLAGMTADDHMRLFTTFTATLLADFARYLQRDDIDYVRDGVGYHTLPLYLTDDEFAEMAKQLNAVIVPLLENQPAPGRVRRNFSTVFFPVDDPTGDV